MLPTKGFEMSRLAPGGSQSHTGHTRQRDVQDKNRCPPGRKDPSRITFGAAVWYVVPKSGISARWL